MIQPLGWNAVPDGAPFATPAGRVLPLLLDARPDVQLAVARIASQLRRR